MSYFMYELYEERKEGEGDFGGVYDGFGVFSGDGLWGGVGGG